MKLRTLISICATLLCVAVFFPFQLYSADPAGFAPNLWFSKEPFFQGDSIKIYTALYNSESLKLSGTIVFLDGSSTIGSTPFTLGTGESKIFSISWNATAGTHNISAEIREASFALTDGSTRPAALSKTSIAAAQIAVAPKPVEPLSSVVNHADTAAVTNFVTQSAPFIAPVVQSILSASDTLRDRGVAILAESINEQRGDVTASTTEAVQETVSTASSTTPLSASSSSQSTATKNTQAASVSSFQNYLDKAVLATKQSLYYLLKHSYLYYPVVVLGFIFLMRILYVRLVARKV